MRRLRGQKVEQVGVRLPEDLAAQLDEYVRDLQRKMGEDVVVYRADAVRRVLGDFLRRRSAQQGHRARRR